MFWPLIIGGLSLGAVSSLHCVGMCGPLALALPTHHLARGQQLVALFLYQLGRVITYAALGLLFGLAGRRVYIAGWQQGFSIALGIIVILLVIAYAVFRNPLQPRIFQKFFYAIQRFVVSIYGKKRSTAGFLLPGMANGLLPCAMVYIAIAAALATGSVLHSVTFMASFGFGTLPAMLLIGYFGRMAGLPLRNLFRKATPVFMAVIGLVLILRGLNLGIPFISPVMQEAPGAALSCHP